VIPSRTRNRHRSNPIYRNHQTQQQYQEEDERGEGTGQNRDAGVMVLSLVIITFYHSICLPFSRVQPKLFYIRDIEHMIGACDSIACGERSGSKSKGKRVLSALISRSERATLDPTSHFYLPDCSSRTRAKRSCSESTGPYRCAPLIVIALD
jgi:hypothetical protein